MSDEDRTEGTNGDRRDDEMERTGHDKYRPIILGSDRSDPRRNRRGRQTNTDRSESNSAGRNTEGTRGRDTTGTEPGGGRHGREQRTDPRHQPRTDADDAHRSASDRHRSGRDGRPPGRRHHNSQSRRQGRSGESPHAGSQRGSHHEDDLGGRLGGHRGGDRSGPDDDQESLGNRYRSGGRRGGSRRDRRYGSRRGNSARRDPRRE